MLVEWVKQRLALCSRKIGAWHFRKTLKTYHGGRYCLQCWMSEMTGLPQSSLAWRLEHTGVDTRIDQRAETDRYLLLEAARTLASSVQRIAAFLPYLASTKAAEKGSRRGKGR